MLAAAAGSCAAAGSAGDLLLVAMVSAGRAGSDALAGARWLLTAELRQLKICPLLLLQVGVELPLASSPGVLAPLVLPLQRRLDAQLVALRSRVLKGELLLLLPSAAEAATALTGAEDCLRSVLVKLRGGRLLDLPPRNDFLCSVSWAARLAGSGT